MISKSRFIYSDIWYDVKDEYHDVVEYYIKYGNPERIPIDRLWDEYHRDWNYVDSRRSHWHGYYGNMFFYYSYGYLKCDLGCFSLDKTELYPDLIYALGKSYFLIR